MNALNILASLEIRSTIVFAAQSKKSRKNLDFFEKPQKVDSRLIPRSRIFPKFSRIFGFVLLTFGGHPRRQPLLRNHHSPRRVTTRSTHAGGPMRTTPQSTAAATTGATRAPKSFFWRVFFWCGGFFAAAQKNARFFRSPIDLSAALF